MPVKDIKSQCLEADDDYFLLFFPFICKGEGGDISLVLMIVIHDQR